jgi:hypothetical protein
MENFDIKEIRQRVKDLFKKGQVQDSFKVLDNEMLAKARELGNLFNVLESLILYARFELEIGAFT